MSEKAEMLALANRLQHATVTAQNDDLSEPRSEKRQRHSDRIDVMLEAVAALRSSAGAEPEPVASPPVVAWECTDDRYPAIKGIVTDRHVTVDAWLQSGIDFAKLGRIVAAAPAPVPAGVREALESIASRKVIRHGGYLRCHVCGYKSHEPHTEERHSPNCARQVAIAALAALSPAQPTDPTGEAFLKLGMEGIAHHMERLQPAQPTREEIIRVIAADPDFGEIASRKDCERLCDAIFALSKPSEPAPEIDPGAEHPDNYRRAFRK